MLNHMDTSEKPSVIDDEREIVKAGFNYFAVVVDVQTKELRIFRPSGAQISFEAIRIPEMP
jgi:hypothetical protein